MSKNKHQCVCDPGSNGQDWKYRGVDLSDQFGSGVGLANRWIVHHPDRIHASTHHLKAEALKKIDT